MTNISTGQQLRIILTAATHYYNMGSESNYSSSQESHKIFGDINIFSVLAYCLHWTSGLLPTL